VKATARSVSRRPSLLQRDDRLAVDPEEHDHSDTATHASDCTTLLVEMIPLELIHTHRHTHACVPPPIPPPLHLYPSRLSSCILSPSPNSLNSALLFTLPLLCSKGDNIRLKPLSHPRGQTDGQAGRQMGKQADRRTNWCLMHRYRSNLQYISSPHFHTHTQLLQMTCSLIIMAQELHSSLAEERQDRVQREESGMFVFELRDKDGGVWKCCKWSMKEVKCPAGN